MMRQLDIVFWECIIWSGIAAGGWLFGKLIMMTLGYKH